MQEEIYLILSLVFKRWIDIVNGNFKKSMHWSDSRRCTAIYSPDHLIFLVIVVKLQMYAKCFWKDRKITQSWKRLENVYVCFYVIFA